MLMLLILKEEAVPHLHLVIIFYIYIYIYCGVYPLDIQSVLTRLCLT